MNFFLNGNDGFETKIKTNEKQLTQWDQSWILNAAENITTEVDNWSQSYQIFISLFFGFLLLSSAILKYRQYFLILQTLKLTNKKQKKSLFYQEKSLVGMTPGHFLEP